MSLTPIALEIDQGDDEVIEITIRDKNDAVVDITGVDLHFAAGTSTLEDPVLEKVTPTQITILPDQSGADKGKATIAIDKADTETLLSKYLGRYLKWELEGVDSLAKEVTLARGTLLINRDMVL